MPKIYLDNAASTQITKPVLDEMLPYLAENYGNPSSLYSLGRQSKQAIEKARKQIATVINAEPSEIFFTSGATESNNIIANSFKVLIAEPTEHPSITNQPNRSESSVFDNDVCVSKMLVNNETGDIFDTVSAKKFADTYGYKFHTDATQAFGHIPINVKTIGCDYLTLSGHKFHASKGVGILYVKNGDTSLIGQVGGGQERGFRAGTENVASIVGMGKAAELYNYNEERDKHMRKLKSYLLDNLAKVEPYHLNSFNPNNCVPNIASLAFKDVDGESLLLMLDNAGICVSAGSACCSGSLEMSKVLKALHTPDNLAYGTIRVSMSEFTTIEELDTFINTLHAILTRLRGSKTSG